MSPDQRVEGALSGWEERRERRGLERLDGWFGMDGRRFGELDNLLEYGGAEGVNTRMALGGRGGVRMRDGGVWGVALMARTWVYISSPTVGKIFFSSISIVKQEDLQFKILTTEYIRLVGALVDPSSRLQTFSSPHKILSPAFTAGDNKDIFCTRTFFQEQTVNAETSLDDLPIHDF